jgi:PA14 domain
MKNLKDLPPSSIAFLAVVGFFLYGFGLISKDMLNFLVPNPAQIVSETKGEQQKQINVIVRNENDLSPIAGVKVEFSYKGSPTDKKTESNGYVKHTIPSREDVEIVLTKSGFETLRKVINLEVDPQDNIQLYMTPENPKQADFSQRLSNTSSSPGSKNQEAVINGGGWWADYYTGEFGTLVSSDEFPEQKPGGTLNKHWGDDTWPPVFKKKPDQFSIIFTAKRNLEKGKYRFFVDADDRSRVRVNSKLVIDAWFEGSRQQEGYFESNGGVYEIQVDYKNDLLNAFIHLGWEKIE